MRLYQSLGSKPSPSSTPGLWTKRRDGERKRERESSYETCMQGNTGSEQNVIQQPTLSSFVLTLLSSLAFFLPHPYNSLFFINFVPPYLNFSFLFIFMCLSIHAIRSPIRLTQFPPQFHPSTLWLHSIDIKNVVI